MSGSIIYTDESGSAVALWFDITVSTVHAFENAVSEHAIEKGADIVDHVRAKPRKLTFVGLVTNTPLIQPESHTDGARGREQPTEVAYPVKTQLPVSIPGVGALMNLIGADRKTETAKVSVFRFDKPIDRVASVFAEVERLMTSASTVIVETPLRTYESMQITSCSVPQEAKDGGSATFTFEAVQVRFVSTQIVPAPKDKIAAKKSNRGGKPAESVPDGGSFVSKAIDEGRRWVGL